MLLDQGASPDEYDRHGVIPLVHAIVSGVSAELIERLVTRENVNMYTNDDESTPLHFAVLKHRYELHCIKTRQIQ